MKTYKSSIPFYSLKKNPSDIKKSKIGCSKDAYLVAKEFYFDDLEIYESFFILLLNRSNNTLAWCKISQGGITGTVIDVRLIAKYAVDSLACAVVLCHNHPSGNMKPSQNDIDITRKAVDALKLLDIKVLDHIILGPDDQYFSFADDGLIL